MGGKSTHNRHNQAQAGGMPMRLFISYAHVDKPLVSQLVEILRLGGHDPWFDHRLVPGQDWKAQLLRQITDCEAFLYALSPESVASEWCQWEFAQAVALGRPIIPVLLQAGTHRPEALSRYQYADFSHGPTPEAVASLLGGLLSIAVTIPASQAPPAPSEPRGVPAQAQPEAPAPGAGPSPAGGGINITQTATGSRDVLQIGMVQGEVHLPPRDDHRPPAPQEDDEDEDQPA